MFSTIFRELRINNNLIQKELGQKLGISLSSISMYERGERQPDLETLIRISKFFAVSTDFLLGLTDVPNIYDSQNTKKITSLTENEAELLEIFNKVTNERDQIKLIGRFDEIVDQMTGNFKSNNALSTPSKKDVG